MRPSLALSALVFALMTLPMTAILRADPAPGEAPMPVPPPSVALMPAPASPNGGATAAPQTAPAADPDLPQSFDMSALSPLVSRSPFTRIVAFEDTYLLTGVAYLDGKPMATLMNKETKQRYVVTDQPNAMGWKLINASPTANPKHAKVTLQVGGEEFSLTYHEIVATPATTGRRDRYRETGDVDIHKLREEDVIRRDENGQSYVRGSIYLPTADRDYYYNRMPEEARDKFRNAIRDDRERMFRMSPDERASHVKRTFDRINSQSGGGGSSSSNGSSGNRGGFGGGGDRGGFRR